MKKTKLKSNQTHFSNLMEDNIIQIIHMNDYFGDGLPHPSKPLRVVDFTNKYLKEIIEDNEDMTVSEAFDQFCYGSGDGDENFSVVTVINGEVYTVIPSEVNENF